MDNNQINEIIIRYLDGSASVDEKRILLGWLKETELNRNEFNQIRDIWLSCEAALPQEDETNIAFSRLKGRILDYETKPVRSIKTIRYWIQAAAVVLILLGMNYWYTQRTVTVIEKEVVIYNQLITAAGSKGEFTLSDGTTVWLNANSKLIYPEIFENDKRKVKLEGEGYFMVTHDEKKPFIVEAGGLDVEVLGTSFDISCYPFKKTTDVVLINGKVKVGGAKIAKSITMTPNCILEYDNESGKSKVSNAQTGLYIDWIKDRLVFDNTRLSDIIISLEGWYNITIDCPSGYAQKTRMSFTVRNETIDEILRAMSLIIPIEYTKKEHAVTIMPK